MVKLTEDFIFRLKTTCDIMTVVSNYVELKSCGRNKKCCCPFHSEKTPSFVVFEATNSFYCFGCGVGGDVITFIEKIENLEYVEAVRFLAKIAGIEFKEEKISDERTKLKRKILEINREAARFFFKNLTKKEGRNGLHYLVKIRGLKKKIITKFGLGVSLDSWNSLRDYLKELGYTYEEMVACDLVLKSKSGRFYDKFRNRVMFPIIDLKGDILGFGGRRLTEDGPKYLNSADTLVFKKSFGLYGLNVAKNSDGENFLLCEGYMDVLMLHQNGLDSAVATLGTSLTKDQARLLCRNKKDVILAYDMDNAGRIAAERANSLFKEVGITAKVLNFKSAKDPDEYVKKFGIEKFKRAVIKAEPLEKIKFRLLDNKYDLKDTEQKRKYIEEFCEIVADIKDSLKREIEIAEICQKFSLNRFTIQNYVKSLMKRKRMAAEKNLKRRLVIEMAKQKKKDNGLPNKVLKAEEGILRFLFYNPDKINLINKELKEDCFKLDWHKKVFSLLKEVISKKKELDFSIFHGFDNEKFYGEIVRIINSGEIEKNTLVELKDYINVLKNYKEETKFDLDVISLEDLEEIRRKKAELKR